MVNCFGLFRINRQFLQFRHFPIIVFFWICDKDMYQIYKKWYISLRFLVIITPFFLSAKALPVLLQRDGVDTSSANVHPCTFADGEFLLCKNIAAAWNYRHPWQVQKLTSLSIFEREFLLRKNVAIAWNHRRPWRF